MLVRTLHSASFAHAHCLAVYQLNVFAESGADDDLPDDESLEQTPLVLVELVRCCAALTVQVVVARLRQLHRSS